MEMNPCQSPDPAPVTLLPLRQAPGPHRVLSQSSRSFPSSPVLFLIPFALQESRSPFLSFHHTHCASAGVPTRPAFRLSSCTRSFRCHNPPSPQTLCAFSASTYAPGYWLGPTCPLHPTRNTSLPPPPSRPTFLRDPNSPIQTTEYNSIEQHEPPPTALTSTALWSSRLLPSPELRPLHPA